MHLKFLGVLFGVAIRTKKPLQLHIAPPMWKLLVGMSLTMKDLEDVSGSCVRCVAVTIFFGGFFV